MAKKLALLIYPGFSNYEIAFIGPMAVSIGREIRLVAKTMEPVTCEDGFSVMPHLTFEDFLPEDCDCLILPGIGGNVMAVLEDAETIAFLQQFKGREDYTLAAICIGPTLLAKAGLLAGRQFCCNICQEDKHAFPFMDFELIRYRPVVADGNVVTALDVGFREFAMAIARRLGYTCREDWFGELRAPYDPARFIFHAGQWERFFTPVQE